MKKQILTALLAAAMLSPAVYAAGAHAAAHPAPSVQPAKAKGIWIDVRTPEEYQEGHLADAVNIPLDQIANKISATAADKNAPSTSTANPAAVPDWPNSSWKKWATPTSATTAAIRICWPKA